jgi:hypothetical protein
MPEMRDESVLFSRRRAPLLLLLICPLLTAASSWLYHPFRQRQNYAENPVPVSEERNEIMEITGQC